MVTYVTPIEHVLEDIRRVCGAKEVTLVVRKEDETDVVFGPPERQSGGFRLEQESSAGAGPLVYNDDELGEILGAESESDKGSPMST